MDRDERIIAALKTRLREHWYVRTTEWPLGHQVVLCSRDDPRRCLVTSWRASERAAWEEAERLAEATEAHESAPMLH